MWTTKPNTNRHGSVYKAVPMRRVGYFAAKGQSTINGFQVFLLSSLLGIAKSRAKVKRRQHAVIEAVSFPGIKDWYMRVRIHVIRTLEVLAGGSFPMKCGTFDDIDLEMDPSQDSMEEGRPL